MSNCMRNEHIHGLAVAHARVDVRAAFANTTAWDFSTKPYGNQRPSGAPPG